MRLWGNVDATRGKVGEGHLLHMFIKMAEFSLSMDRIREMNFTIIK